jgi:hypothetical protein
MLDPRKMYPIVVYDNRNPEFTDRGKAFTRTQQPSRYYWSDYGLANKKPDTHLVPYVRGCDKEYPDRPTQIPS